MKDLSQGSIVSHIAVMAPQIFVGMILMMLCGLIDLYFVAGLGDAAIAGVGAAGNVGFLINALTQILSVGAVSLISQAVGRKDRADANLIFNQSLGLSAAGALFTMVAGCMLARSYMRSVAVDEAVIEAGTTYLVWFVPALALQFVALVMGSALRGTGIVRPTVIVQAVTVIINMLLAPILISGWGTGLALGVAGAGLASTIAVAIGVAMMWIYFHRYEHYVAINSALWRPQLEQWKRILGIGLPAGGEFAIIFLNMAVIYFALRHFGAAAQAGFSIGSRLLGLIHMPGISIALAAGAIAGQNFGAGNGERVRRTFKTVLLLVTAVMIGFTMIAQWRPEFFLGGFTEDAATIAVGALFLRMVSLNNVAQGVNFVCSSMFQGLGNTRPVLLSSGARLLTNTLPLIWLSAMPGFRIEHAWYLSIATTTLQAGLSLWLLRLEFRKRLGPVLQ
ncbi:MATE family efflux transporter [Bradyrhizobium sediminis]|uniref:MATE family efflux transporter n=1 Tax=Bradyrhizobium sediminis TaxID=2840469 RepID=A0A975P105_9BRAD|nr:MATE family efflux transporter [Bradyrhizobium sediminis]QWG24620.1 MATE family efflux transporter [Bradyrhizobium sediminis]